MLSLLLWLVTIDGLARRAGRACELPGFPNELFPLGRQTGLGFHENFENGTPVFGGEALKLGTLISAAENFKQTPVDLLFGRRRDGVESLRIDEIATGVSENASLEVELAE
jgi:hypothetical protein